MYNSKNNINAICNKLRSTTYYYYYYYNILLYHLLELLWFIIIKIWYFNKLKIVLNKYINYLKIIQ
jgi:hypothetical protein